MSQPTEDVTVEVLLEDLSQRVERLSKAIVEYQQKVNIMLTDSQDLS